MKTELLAAAAGIIAGTVLGLTAARYQLRHLTSSLHAALTASTDRQYLAVVVAGYRRRLTRWGAR